MSTGTIEWIENTAGCFETEELVALTDPDEAIHIAREEALGIENPSRRVNAFVADLPELFGWFRNNHRDFPWRRTRNPWAIIVAEIMLQRTHAVKAAEIYKNFFGHFPDVIAVNEAGFDDVFEIIEPLGFGNKKTKTLKTLAKTLVEDYDSEVPNDLDMLMDLPRIGPYTARACLCFAFGEPLAIVDANIETVVEHVFGYGSSTRAHKDRALYALLDALIPHDPDAARLFNLALLDLRVCICELDAERLSCPLACSCSYRKK